MTSITDTTAVPRTSASSDPVAAVAFFRDAMAGSRLLVLTSAIYALGFVMCIGLQQLDSRLLLGVSVWEKPSKFFLSLGLHLLTVAWGLSLIAPKQREALSIRWSVWLMAAAATLELAYIVFRAARGEASHFNVGTPLASALYTLMGIGAVTLTFTAGYVGYRIWRADRASLWNFATGFGFMLGALLATATAGYMASNLGHAVGGDASDATGLPFLHWSTTGGDLRVSHFIGLHAMQVLPLTALSGRRSIVVLAAVAITVLTGLTFIQARMGIPLFAG